jgi:phenylacetate-CoA ligase
MSDSLLRLYHQLPSPLRSAAASVHGFHLNRWRYGRDTERLVAEAREREMWSSERWKTWQEERLEALLHRAATRVPYYREHWLKRRRRGDGASWSTLANWPVLTKEALRAQPNAFVADDHDIRRMFKEHTSGTTGTPLTLWCTRQVLHSWYALFEARWRRWYGVSLADRWAILGGRQVIPFGQTTPPFWVWNAGARQLYMSALHVRPDFLRHYVDALRRYSVVYLYGYASSLYCLALQVLEMGTRVDLKVVLTNAEPLYPHQREAISAAFSCPTRETYGQAEMCCGMSECESRNLHLWPEVGYVEVLDDDGRAVPPHTPGRLICTGLLNTGMPLIRYEVRDMVQLPVDGGLCTCGRTLPLVDKVIGRLDDAILTNDGRRMSLLDIVFGPHMHVREAQLVQNSLDSITVRVVPADGWSSKDERAIRSALQQRLGNVGVTIEPMPHIERTWAGKFRVMISNVTSEPMSRV